MKPIIGAGGKGGGSGGINEGPNTLRSIAYAKFVDLIAEGEVEGLVNGLQSIYYNQVPLQNADSSYNFKGVQVTFLPGTQGQAPIKGFEEVANEFAVGVKVFQGTPIVRTLSEADLTLARVTLSFPSLYAVNSDGSITGTAVEFKIERQSNGAGYVGVIHQTINGKTNSKYQMQYDVPLTGDPPWDIRVTRITADNTSTTLSNDLYWDTYDTVINASLSYPNSAIIATSIDSSQFNTIPTRAYHLKLLRIQVPTNYDPVARTYSGTWDGTFKIAWSNNPAWCYYDLLTNSRYGLGRYIPANSVDKWALYTIGRYCDELVDDGKGGTEPRFTCNVYLQTLQEAYTLLQQMTSVFRGMAFWAGGAITTVQDSPSDPIYQYTAANVIDGKFSYAGASSKARHTVALVTWNNPNNFYAQDVQYVEDKDGIAKYGVISTQVVAIGCTSQGQAERVGRWLLYSERLESEVVTFSTGLEGAVGRPGHVVQVMDPLRAGKRFGGRLISSRRLSVGLPTDMTLRAVSPSDYSRMIALVSYGGAASGFRRFEALVSGLGPYVLPASPDGVATMVFLDDRLIPAANYSITGQVLSLVGIAPSNYQRIKVLFTAGSTASGYFRYEVAVSGAGPYTLPSAPDGALTMVFLDGGLIPASNYTISGTSLTFSGLSMGDYQNLAVIASSAAGPSGVQFARLESTVSGLGPYTLSQVPDGGLVAVFLDGYLLSLSQTVFGSTVELTLDAPVRMLAASGYEVSLVSAALGIAAYAVAPVGVDGDYSTLVLTSPIAALPDPMTVWVLSGTELVPQLFRIISVAEASKNVYQISAVANDPSKYGAIDSGLALVPRNISINAALPAAPTTLTLVEAVGPSGSAYSLEINASWDSVMGVAGYELQYFIDSDNQVSLPNTNMPSARIPLSRVGTYTVSVRSVNLQGKRSVPITSTAYFDGSTLVLQTPQRHVAGTTVGSVRSTWSGITISYTAAAGTPATATISATAATLNAGSATTSYNASSASVTGTNGAVVLYYLWYEDPGFKGGAQTLHYDTTGAGLTSADGIVYVGSVSVTFPSSGTGGGGGNPGGGACVADDCCLPLGPASRLEIGSAIACVDDGSLATVPGAVRYASRSHQLCVRVLTVSGTPLTCTLDAPLRRQDGSYVYASEALGHAVAVLYDGVVRWEEVVSVTHVGVRKIVMINAGDRCFWAGDLPGRYILHHNAGKLTP